MEIKFIDKKNQAKTNYWKATEGINLLTTYAGWRWREKKKERESVRAVVVYAVPSTDFHKNMEIE